MRRILFEYHQAPAPGGGTDHALGGTVACVVATSGAAVVTRGLAAAVACVVASTGSLGVARGVAGSATGAVVVSGAVNTGLALAGSVSGTLATSGALTVDRGLAGSATGAVTTSATCAVDYDLEATASCLVATSGSLAATRALTASATASVSTSGALSVNRELDGSAVGAVSTSGALSVSRGLAGSAAGVVQASAALAVDRGLQSLASTSVETHYLQLGVNKVGAAFGALAGHSSSYTMVVKLRERATNGNMAIWPYILTASDPTQSYYSNVTDGQQQINASGGQRILGFRRTNTFNYLLGLGTNVSGDQSWQLTRDLAANTVAARLVEGSTQTDVASVTFGSITDTAPADLFLNMFGSPLGVPVADTMGNWQVISILLFKDYTPTAADVRTYSNPAVLSPEAVWTGGEFSNWWTAQDVLASPANTWVARKGGVDFALTGITSSDVVAIPAAGVPGPVAVEVEASGAVGVSRGLAGAATTAVSATGSLSTRAALSGSTATAVQATGALAVSYALSGEATCAVEATADLTPGRALASSAVGAVTASGELGVFRIVPMSGSAACTASAWARPEFFDRVMRLVATVATEIRRSATVSTEVRQAAVVSTEIRQSAEVATELSMPAVVSTRLTMRAPP